ncbi:uncharacterized protein FPRO_01354 [Fusarium proliferatum ET1]|uniref:Secreted protein n=1 Tax=Fusarium proliferatum (strain ET1) TaxID=1227346 RepID=A0A1L7V5I7_FUSPR|nr:uncharacterized protein FPRO_01354 [Fusarium proliferatum ET1]CZR34302.1 uncharacterized protein FPRO_01354 [Fusarium proliferatum ET1]
MAFDLLGPVVRSSLLLVVVVSARFRPSASSQVCSPTLVVLRCAGGDLRHSHPSQICIPTQNTLTLVVEGDCGYRRQLET